MEMYKLNCAVTALVGMCLVMVTTVSQAQGSGQEVREVIERLFDGMRAKDPQMLSAVFLEKAPMQTIVSTDDGASVQSDSVEDFVKRIAQIPPETQLDERILDYQIKIDGNLAAVWTPYEFYVNGKFSHCGVNSFQLVRTAEGWKIAYIIDTRRTEGC